MSMDADSLTNLHMSRKSIGGLPRKAKVEAAAEALEEERARVVVRLEPLLMAPMMTSMETIIFLITKLKSMRLMSPSMLKMNRDYTPGFYAEGGTRN